MKALAGLTVLVLGLGDTGLAMARWCARHGAAVRVWDSRDEPPQAPALREQWPAVAIETGALDAARLAGVQRVLKSPGLAPHEPRIAALLDAARAAKIPVQGEVDLFTETLDELRAEQGYAPKLVAITGTNGKTTTTALTALLIERCGRRTVSAGNIGPTMLDTLAAAIDAPAESRPEVWVLELSSFQLHDCAGIEPDAATVLNVTQDHLDWHGSMAAYAAAKARIFGRRAAMVVNRDDAAVMAMVPAASPASAAAKGPKAKAMPPRTVVRFGLDAPQHPGDFGLLVEQGMPWLARALPLEEGAGRRSAEPEELHLQRLMPADALRLRGRHNAANALAALALATAIGCPLAPMLHGLREYNGEPHRVAPIGLVGGVEAFDDSKGTNVGATVAALDGLGADRAPARLAVILGGDGKGQDFAALAAPLARHARAVALIGRDAAAIEAAIESALAAAGVPVRRHGSLPEAVSWCFAQSMPGDAVLLSPACASLDMFRGYAHRAEVFADAVRALALERGEVPA
jgi:UDP-N-acetylmuramoylalanine--D-glutamate ligase